MLNTYSFNSGPKYDAALKTRRPSDTARAVYIELLS